MPRKLVVKQPFNYREGHQTYHYPKGTYGIGPACSKASITEVGAKHAVEKLEAAEYSEADAKPAEKPAASDK